jgi:small neutral amino acid transporter SnatA (MarC family)
MYKFLIILLLATGLHLTLNAAETNSLATNSVSTNSAFTNSLPSEAELQTAAHGVLLKLAIFAIFALVGGLVVSGFAVYGAYRAFGVKGVIIIGIIAVLLLFLIGSILSEAF